MTITNFAWADFPLYFLWFMFFSMLGWAWESTLNSVRDRRFINRGFLNGPYCPIYGVGALVFIFTTNSLLNPVWRFIIGAILACALEYLTSYFLEKIFHARWWDYSWRFANLHGRVCLIGFIVFGLAAVALPYIQLWLEPFTRSLPASLTNSLFAILTIVLIADIISTSKSLARFNRILREYQQAIDKHRLDFLEFIRRGRHAFAVRLHQNGHFHKVLTFQQRRILSAFPHLTSVRYTEALDRLRTINDEDHTGVRKPARTSRHRVRRRAKKS